MTILRRHISADKGTNFKFFLLPTLFLAPAEAIRTAIPHLTQLVFAKGRQKQNQLNLPPHSQYGVARRRHVFAHLPTVSHKRSPAAAWHFMLKTCINAQVKNPCFYGLTLMNKFNTLVR